MELANLISRIPKASELTKKVQDKKQQELFIKVQKFLDYVTNENTDKRPSWFGFHTDFTDEWMKNEFVKILSNQGYVCRQTSDDTPISTTYIVHVSLPSQ